MVGNPSELSLTWWIQAGIRFALELAMLAGFAYWGYNLSETTLIRLFLAILLPAAAAIAWGVFRAPEDTSAGKPGIVPVPGWVRLLLELGLFGLSIFGIWWAGSRIAAETLLTFTVLHYLLTWQRVKWLILGR